MIACLDSWAVVEWLHGREPSYSRLDELWPQRPVMSWINLGEVAYYTRRALGRRRGQGVVAQLRAALELDEATPERVLSAADLKADHGIGYADAFAVATAIARDATLLTGDAALLARAACAIEDLRSTASES